MIGYRRGKLERASVLLNLVLIVLIIFLVRQVVMSIIEYNPSNEVSISISADDGIEAIDNAIIGTNNKKERAIDGVLIDSSNTDSYPKMVTIENHSSARPQSGIDTANLVIEVPVEGGITRFLAVFVGDSDVTEIGPIRSARPYFLDWASEFDALYVHVGGSPDALSILKNRNDIYNLNQYFESKYFWRSSKRVRPHNVYSSSELLNIAIDKKELKDSEFKKWRYKDDGPVNDVDLVDSISVNFSTYINNIEWIYSIDDNKYTRHQAGKIHKAINGNNIESKNIIIQKTSITSIDKEDRKDVQTIGGGDAIIFLDGDVIFGRWEKLSMDDRTMFYNNNGEDVLFNRGITWIEVVDKNTDVIF